MLLSGYQENACFQPLIPNGSSCNPQNKFQSVKCGLEYCGFISYISMCFN